MGLADEISQQRQSLQRRSGTATCTMALIMAHLDGEDGAAMDNLMADRRVYGTSIADLLNGWGPKISDAAAAEKAPDERRRMERLAQLCEGIAQTTVQRHRSGRCLCPKTKGDS